MELLAAKQSSSKKTNKQTERTAFNRVNKNTSYFSSSCYILFIAVLYSEIKRLEITQLQYSNTLHTMHKNKISVVIFYKRRDYTHIWIIFAAQVMKTIICQKTP